MKQLYRLKANPTRFYLAEQFISAHDAARWPRGIQYQESVGFRLIRCYKSGLIDKIISPGDWIIDLPDKSGIISVWPPHAFEAQFEVLPRNDHAIVNAECSPSIDNVTTKLLASAFAHCGIGIANHDVIDQIIDIVELIEEKGENTTLGDLNALQKDWNKCHK